MCVCVRICGGEENLLKFPLEAGERTLLVPCSLSETPVVLPRLIVPTPGQYVANRASRKISKALGGGRELGGV